jgi:hypothetical protein
MKQNDRTLRRIFHLTQEEVRVATDVVTGTLLINNLNVHVLFDPGVTHSFIARKIFNKLGKRSRSGRKGVRNWNSDGNMVETNNIYVGVGLV